MLDNTRGLIKGRLSIIMYHFVRDLQHSRYPNIKGLSLHDFKEQIEYIRKHYTVISMNELMSALSDKDFVLPPNALLLTFDDGYVDHFTNVSPLPDEKGMQGSFSHPLGQYWKGRA